MSPILFKISAKQYAEFDYDIALNIVQLEFFIGVHSKQVKRVLIKKIATTVGFRIIRTDQTGEFCRSYAKLSSR